MVVELLRAARHAPERLLHRVRRRSARATLKRARPRSLLVICHGNICRSPFAEVFLKRLLDASGTEVTSAGFIGPGRTPPQEAIGEAARRGEDLSSHRS